MTISSQLLERYAKSFAVAFPEYSDRQRMAMIAEVSGTAQVAGEALDAWRDILHCAHASGTLLQLVEAANSLKPNNRAILKLHGILEGRAAEHSKVRRVVLVAFMGAFGALLLVWTSSIQRGVDVDTSPSDLTTTGVVEEFGQAQSVTEAAVASPEGEGLAGDLGIQELGGDLDEPEIEAASSLTIEVPSGRCSGAIDSIVGYFYVGDGIEALSGDIHVMTTSAYVRGDYPRRENGWDYAVPATCSLRPGDRVMLREDPILVDGEKYWVALYGGSLGL